jgi:hypothetical protein
MADDLGAPERFDQFGLQTPFAAMAPPFGSDEGRLASHEDPSFEFFAPQSSWAEQLDGASAGAAGDDPAQLAEMLAIKGRFDDPKRDRALELDGARFVDFLSGKSRREFAAAWLASRPGLALAAREPNADLKAGDIAKAWFIIHDVGAGATLTDQRFKASDPKVKKNAVHGFLNRGGYYAATHDFDKNRMGTVYEFLSKRGKSICGGKTINIETTPDVETVTLKPDGSMPPPSNGDRYASIGYRLSGKGKAKYYKWTTEALDVLADLYILASARAGHLLTISVHKEMDRNLGRSVIWREYDANALRATSNKFLLQARDKPSNYHGDPYAFDVQALYDRITAKLNALGARQAPAGARYGVHPSRLRRADGRDIGNSSAHLHEFPHQ